MPDRNVSVRYEALMGPYKAALLEGAVANGAFSASITAAGVTMEGFAQSNALHIRSIINGTTGFGAVTTASKEMAASVDESSRIATLANKAFASSVGGAAKDIGGHFGALGSEASSALSGMTGSAGIATLGIGALAVGIGILGEKGLKSFEELGAQVRQFQLVTGASAKEASEFVGMLNELGIDSASVAQGIVHLNTQIDKHAEVLAADGVVVARSKDGQVDLIGTLENVAAAYQAAGGGAAGLTVATDAFGAKMAKNLIPALQLTHGELQKMFAEVQAHGGVLTQNDIDNAYAMHLAMKGLGESVQGLERGLVTGLVPALTTLVHWLSTAADWGIKTEHALSWANDQSHGVLGRAIEYSLPVIGQGLMVRDAIQGAGRTVGLIGNDPQQTKDSATAEQDLATAEAAAADAAKEVDQARKDLSDTTKIYKDALGGISDAEMKGRSTQDAYTKGLVDFADAVKQGEQDGDKFAASLDSGTDAGLRNRAALDGLTQSAFDHAQALVAQGAGADQVAAALAGDENELASLGARLGMSQNDLQPWIRAMQDAAFAARDFSYASSQALSNPALAGLINAVQYLGIYTPPSTKAPLPANVGRAAAGANVNVPKDTSASDQAKAVADYLKSLDDARKQQEQVEDFQWQHGFITNEKYKALLDQRLANSQTFSAEWQDALEKEDAITQRKADANQAAADAAKKAADDRQAAMDKANAALAKSLQDESSILQKELDTLTQRRDALFNWADPNQKVSIGWANSTSALTKNIQDQTGQLKEWGQLLAQVEAEGLSSTAVGYLGLDKGPSSLAELRQLAKTPGQIVGLNAAIGDTAGLAEALAKAQPVAVTVAPSFNVDVQIGDESFTGMVQVAITQLNNEAAIAGDH